MEAARPNGDDPVDLDWGRLKPNALGRALIAVSRHTALGRGRGRILAKTLLSLLHEGPVDTKIWGTPVRLHPNFNVSERKALFRPDRCDPAELAFVRAELSQPNSVFVDVGANAGIYSVCAGLSAGAGSSILAIEPDPTLLSRLVFNFELGLLNRTIDASINLMPLNVAVSNREMEVLLVGSPEQGSQSVAMSGVGRPVTARTLVSILAEARLDRVDLLKIDIEGHEDRALPCFFEAVPDNKLPRSLIVEHLARAEWQVDCIDLAISRGFAVVCTTRNNTLMRRRST